MRDGDDEGSIRGGGAMLVVAEVRQVLGSMGKEKQRDGRRGTVGDIHNGDVW
jgi:hypothetical protein